MFNFDNNELEALLNYINKHKREIYVRDIKEGKVGSYNLEELSNEQIMDHVMRWLKEEIIPIRIKE